MPIKPVQDPTLPAGTTPGHLQFAAPGFYGQIASPSPGNNGPNVFSPKHPLFQNLLNMFFRDLAERDQKNPVGVGSNADFHLRNIYLHEDPSFEHPECSVEARKFFDRVKATIPIWEDDTFEEIINHLRWRKIRAEQASGYSQGD